MYHNNKQASLHFASRVSHHRRSLSIVLAVSLTAWAGNLMAEEPETSSDHLRQGPVVEEIVVTARRRSENLQDVPIAVTALSGEYLRNHDIDQFEDLRNHAPALTISSAGGSSNEPVVGLRGQRATEATINMEAAVPLYLADVVMTPATGTNLALYDLESVQVLKGPQGTLFGANSTGGAVLFAPKRPGDRFAGSLDVALGDYNHRETELAVDLPASERVKFRVAAQTVRHDGYQEIVSTDPMTRGDEYWDEDSRALRISMVANLTDSLENYLVFNWGESDTNGRQRVLYAHNPDLAPSLRDDVLRVIERDDHTKVESDQTGQFERIETWFASNTTSLEVGDLTFKNIFGYRKVDWAAVTDDDASVENRVARSSTGKPKTTEGEQFSDEFQVLGTALDERLDWIAGLYYYQMQGTRWSRSNILGRLDSHGGGDVDNSSRAVFLQGTYAVLDQLSLTLGARKSWDEREMTVRSHIIVGGLGLCSVEDETGSPLPFENCQRTVDEDWSASTWLASLAYDLNAATMLYGSVSTGYRSGGFNIRGTNNLDLQPFDEEDVITYELGMKGEWSAGDWQFRNNLALYHQDYDDIQRSQGQPDPATGSLITMVLNAASATIQGAELELGVQPSAGLDISLNYAYVDTEYKDYIDDEGVDLAGESFNWIPQDQVTATIRYTLPLDPKLGDLSVQASNYYQSGAKIAHDLPTGYPLQDRALTMDGYNVVDYRLDWRAVMGSTVDLSLYVNNAGDEQYRVGDMTALGSLGFAAYSYGAPRTWGASVRYQF